MTDELLLYQTELDDYVKGLAWCSTREVLYAATAKGSFYMLNPQEDVTLFQHEAHKGGINTLSASPTDAKVVTAGQDNCAKLWDGMAKNLLKEIKTNTWVENIAWSPDGNFFAISAGKAFHLFDKFGNEVGESNPHDSTVAALAWRSDSKKLVSASYGGVRIYDLSKPGEYEQLIWKNSLISLTWSPDHRFIMAGTQDSSIHVWKMDSVDRRDMAMNGYASKARAFAWDESGKKVATNCGVDVVIWDITGKNGPENTKPEVIDAHSAKVTALAYQPGENILTSGDESGRLYWWATQKGKFQFMSGCKIDGAIAHICWNKKGSLLAAGTAEGIISVFEY